MSDAASKASEQARAAGGEAKGEAGAEAGGAQQEQQAPLYARLMEDVETLVKSAKERLFAGTGVAAGPAPGEAKPVERAAWPRAAWAGTAPRGPASRRQGLRPLLLGLVHSPRSLDARRRILKSPRLPPKARLECRLHNSPGKPIDTESTGMVLKEPSFWEKANNTAENSAFLRGFKVISP